MRLTFFMLWQPINRTKQPCQCDTTSIIDIIRRISTAVAMLSLWNLCEHGFNAAATTLLYL